MLSSQVDAPVSVFLCSPCWGSFNNLDSFCIKFTNTLFQHVKTTNQKPNEKLNKATAQLKARKGKNLSSRLLGGLW